MIPGSTMAKNDEKCRWMAPSERFSHLFFDDRAARLPKAILGSVLSDQVRTLIPRRCSILGHSTAICIFPKLLPSWARTVLENGGPSIRTKERFCKLCAEPYWSHPFYGDSYQSE